MAIPESYRVDFSSYKKDLIEQALSRMLSQHYDKCILRQFVAAILEEVQSLYDAIIDLLEQRTLYKAEAENLNALGRIVGEPRTPYQYDETRWMFSNRYGQRTDNAAVWTIKSPFAAYLPVADTQYRMNILTRIVKNHTLVASIPELERLIHMATETFVSYDKTGPMQVVAIVPSTISMTVYNILTASRTNQRTDNTYILPYPATLWLGDIIIYVPDKFFCAERTNEQRCDHAPCAVGVPFQQGGFYYGNS